MQSSVNSQAFNRYSYVVNNPLSLIDPDGHSWLSKGWKRLKKNVKRFVNKWGRTIVAAVAAYYAVGWANDWGTWAAVDAGASGTTAIATGNVAGATAGGATFSGTSTALNGGDLNDVLRSGLRGGVSGALSGGIDVHYGSSWGWGRVMANATVGGVSSAIAGSSFRDGFGSSFGFSSLTYAAVTMRKLMIEQSTLDPWNASGKSVGFKGDGFKLGGGRFDAADIFGINPLGGEQGGEGFLGVILGGKKIGWNYASGSWQDYLVEAFAGPHDFLNSGFWYDSAGNIRQGMTMLEQHLGSVLNATNVVLASPFVAASVTPEYVYNSLGVLR